MTLGSFSISLSVTDLQASSAFYQKLGFRPVDPGVRKLMKRELARMKKDRGYRSDLDTMRELVVDDDIW